jgi:hypothetical protein
MLAVKLDETAVRTQLSRILGSAGFIRNARLSKFLRFVVEEQLEGRGQSLKESLLAVEVFGRKPDYDPKRDPIVRTEAGRLRIRLDQYYMREGEADPLIIDLPKGGYAPTFRERTPWVVPPPEHRNAAGSSPPS